MKILSFFFVVVFYMGGAMQTHAQTRMRGTSDTPITIKIFDSTAPDYKPSLMPVEMHPIPASEYSDKKQLLHQKRLELEAKAVSKKEKPKKKSSDANTVKPKIIVNFEGNMPSGHPADHEIAVSKDGKIVTAVNSNIEVFDSTGRKISSKSLSSFITRLGTINRTSDPRLLYDPLADRFIFVCFSGNLSTNNFIIVGFSQTPDPVGDWNFYKLNGNSFNDSTWSDYPILSITNDDLFMTWNHVKDNVSWTVGFVQSVIWQIDKEYGYKGEPLKYELWSDIKYKNRNLRNICPTKYQTEYTDTNMYFLSMRNVDMENDTIFLLEITNSYKSGKAELKTSVLKTPVKYGFPPNALQGKGLNGYREQLMTNDARVLAAIYQNNTIHFGLNSNNFQYNNAGVMLGRIENVNSSNPKVTSKIFSTDKVEYGYPSMCAIAPEIIPNRVLFTFSHCYTNGLAGTSIVYQNANGEWNQPSEIKKGEVVIDMIPNDSVERWGDYTNAQLVYNNPHTAWIVGSYGGLNTLYNRNGMRTTIAKISISDTIKPTSSIQLIENKSDVSIYPNPVLDFFQTELVLSSKEILFFRIIDIQGKEIAQLLRTEGHPGKNIFSFSLAPLNSGIYWLEILGEKGYTNRVRVEKRN